MDKFFACLGRLCLLGALCILLLACQTTPTPTLAPTNTPLLLATATVSGPAATLTPLPTALPTPLPTSLPSVTKLVTVRDRLALTLPATWQTLEVDANGLEKALSKLQQSGSAVDPASVTRLLASVDPQSTALFAWLGAEGGSATSLLVTMIPRHDLRLESYLASAQRELAQQPGVTVHSAQVDVTLRADGLPVGLLHFTLPPSPTAEPVDGWQITLLDVDATHLVFLTFSTPAAQYPDHLPDFQAIVRTLQWK